MRVKHIYIIIILLTTTLTTPLKAGSVDTEKTNETNISKPDFITFEKTFGGKSSDIGYSVQQTSDGGYIVLGTTSSFGKGGKDMYLIKLSKYGKKRWERTFGGKDDDVGKSVMQTPDGGYIALGYTSSYGEGKAAFYLIKTDKDGKKLWEKIYGGTESDYGNSVNRAEDGGYLLFGHSVQPFNEGSDLYAIKTDSSGRELWQKKFDEDIYDYGYSSDNTRDNGHIFIGTAESVGKKRSYIRLLKTNDKGLMQWAINIGMRSKNLYFPNAINELKNGDFIILGTIQIQDIHFLYLLRVNEVGRKKWSVVFDKRKESFGQAVQETSDGGFIILGYIKTPSPENYDMYLVKTDSDGKMLWEKNYGGFLNDYGYSVEETSDGGYVLLGSIERLGGNGDDIYILKVDKNGEND